MQSYDKQMQWRRAAQLKISKMKQEKELEQEQSLNNKFESKPMPSFIARVAIESDASHQPSYIPRERRGYFQHGIRRPSIASTYTNGSPIAASSITQATNQMDDINDQLSDPHTLDYEDVAEGNRPSYNGDDDDESHTSSTGSSSHQEPIVELLETERRLWREERSRLVQCIHLQQLELNHRYTAAQDRAVDIAKEFARAVEGFEERLLNVEQNMQKDVNSIKVSLDMLIQALQMRHEK